MYVMNMAITGFCFLSRLDLPRIYNKITFKRRTRTMELNILKIFTFTLLIKKPIFGLEIFLRKFYRYKFRHENF